MSETIAGTSADWTGKTYTPDSFPADIDYELRVVAANYMNTLKVYDTAGGGGQAAAATLTNWHRHFLNTARRLQQLSAEYGFSYATWYNLQAKTNTNNIYYKSSPYSGRSYGNPLMSLALLSTDLLGNVSYAGPEIFSRVLAEASTRGGIYRSSFDELRREYARRLEADTRTWNSKTPSQKLVYRNLLGVTSLQDFLEYRGYSGPLGPFNPAQIKSPNAYHVQPGDVCVIRSSVPLAIHVPYLAFGSDFRSFLHAMMNLADNPDVVYIGAQTYMGEPGFVLNFPLGIRVPAAEIQSLLGGDPTTVVAEHGHNWLLAIGDYESVVDWAYRAAGGSQGGVPSHQRYYKQSKDMIAHARSVVTQMIATMQTPGAPDSTTATGPYGPPVLGIHAYNEQTSSPPAGDPLAGDPHAPALPLPGDPTLPPLAGDPHAPALPLPGDPTLPPLAGIPQAGLPVGGEAPAGIPMAALAVLGLAAIALIMSQRRKS